MDHSGAEKCALLTEEEPMTTNTLKSISLIAIAASITLGASSVVANDRMTGRGAPESPVVYVTSQGLYYDSIVVTDFLPFNDTGNFQKLEVVMDELVTEFGPGDVGYYGGRWWMDDGDGVMEETDHYFLCPLLGPGRENP
jgi:hypothetical protein